MRPTPDNPVQGELVRSETLPLGGIRTIDQEIEHIKAVYKLQTKWVNEHGGGWIAEPVEEIQELQDAKDEGYRHVLRLPRVNEGACVRKYGVIYDKTTSYFEFVETLAKRNSIERTQSVNGRMFYVLESQEDAELLRDKLIEHQERTELEFEIIENSDERAYKPTL